MKFTPVELTKRPLLKGKLNFAVRTSQRKKAHYQPMKQIVFTLRDDVAVAANIEEKDPFDLRISDDGKHAQLLAITEDLGRKVRRQSPNRLTLSVPYRQQVAQMFPDVAEVMELEVIDVPAADGVCFKLPSKE